MTGPTPRLPAWAAGCPPPSPQETFRGYVSRLGMDPERLLEGLTPRTAEIANERLAAALQRACPEQFWEYVEQRRVAAGAKRQRWPFPS